jgi:hypothetical protein
MACCGSTLCRYELIGEIDYQFLNVSAKIKVGFEDDTQPGMPRKEIPL